MKLNELISNLVIESKPEYSEEINAFINSHNTVVASFMQNVTTSAILSILYKKNIITDGEFDEEISRCIDMSKQKEVLEQNRDGILECIEAEKTYMDELKAMHESLSPEDMVTDNEPSVSTDTFVDEWDDGDSIASDMSDWE